MAETRRCGARVIGCLTMKRFLLPSVVVTFALLSGCSQPSGAPRTYRNAPVIIISIDTLRADHLPMFGYRGVDTPHFDALRNDLLNK